MCLVATISVLFVGIKIPSKVSEPKWASVQTTLCDIDKVGVTYTYSTGLGVKT